VALIGAPTAAAEWAVGDITFFRRGTTMPRQRLRPYQFTLLGLLLAVTAVSVALSVFAVRRDRIAQERALLKALGNSVTLEEWDNGDLVALGLDMADNTHVDVLRHFVHLEGLYLSGPAITAHVLAHLGSQENLQELCVINPESPMADKGLACLGGLASLKSLTSLSYLGGRVSDEGMRSQANLTNIEVLRVWCPEATDDGLKSLARLRGLRHLWLTNGQKMTGEGLSALQAPERLEVLHMANVTHEGMKTIARFSNLRELSVGGKSLRDESTAFLVELKGLRVLNLGETAISAASMPNLLRIRTLEEITVPFSIQVTPALRKQLAESLPNLKYLKSDADGTLFSPGAANGAGTADENENPGR